MHNYQGTNDKETQRAKLPRLLREWALPTSLGPLVCGVLRWAPEVGDLSKNELWWVPVLPQMGNRKSSSCPGATLNPSSEQPLHLPVCYVSEDEAEISWEPGGGISGLEDALEKTALEAVAENQPGNVEGKQQL